MIILLRTFLLTVVLGLTACASTDNAARQKSADAHEQLAWSYLKLNRLDVAAAEFTTALELRPSQASSYHGKALVFARKGELKKAKKWFAKGLNTGNASTNLINDYALMLCSSNESQRGLQVLADSAVEASALSLGGRLARAHCMNSAGKYTQAESYLQQVLAVQPQLPQALWGMAQSQYGLANYLSARAFLERYAAATKLSERAVVLGYKLETQLGNKQQQQYYLTTLKKLYPNSQDLRQITSE